MRDGWRFDVRARRGGPDRTPLSPGYARNPGRLRDDSLLAFDLNAEVAETQRRAEKDRIPLYEDGKLWILCRRQTNRWSAAQGSDEETFILPDPERRC